MEVNKVMRRRFWPVFLARLYQVCFATWDVRILLPDGSVTTPRDYRFDSMLFAYSERDDLPLAWVMTHPDFIVLVAAGRDGDWASEALQALGGSTVRGSSLQSGSTALLSLIRRLRKHRGPVAICVDGPLGPQGRIQNGVLACARYSGRTVTPLGTAASRCVVFRKTWSQIFLPLPFSRVIISCGSPLGVPRQSGRAEIAALNSELARRLQLERARAEAMVNAKAGYPEHCHGR